MGTQIRLQYVTRESILNLLSDSEVSKVSTAETAASLVDGDEYIDLEALGKGVQQAHGTPLQVGRLLPRSAVHERTWGKILAHLAAARIGARPDL
jgi:hypothetical protein